MVPPDSHRVSRAPWYSGTRPEPGVFRLQDYHLLWCAVPGISTRRLVWNSMWPSPTTPAGPKPHRFGLIRVRSPLLTESQLFSLPRGTEMVHFPRFASSTLCIHVEITGHDSSGVAPFGNPRIKACLPLPEAYRSLLRPSSPLCAKASTVNP
jgi:hypothetical protein